ncbi:MAG TPA: YciI family protein [Polyangiaceae bacterium]|jgi:hypothetical protein|nr:YciI family protein [Polyangiaceae bacterium]
MSEFMVMIHESEAAEAALGPAETRAQLEARAAYEQDLRAAGAHCDGERFRPSVEGRRVRRRDGQLHVDRGPFEEKALGAYYIVEAPNLDAAVALAQACPVSPDAELDVRPVMRGDLSPDKASQQGRVFAFAVLGSAPNEPAWSGIMDRIQEITREARARGGYDEIPGFPAAQRLGGVRLEAPGRGRRVVNTGGRRAVFDGPFLESKEVIGGLFFMRMASLEAAVQWASEKPFLQYGATELRELWRS